MKIKILSDLHYEFFHNLDLSYLDNSNVDMFIIAGDLSVSNKLISTLKEIDEYINVPLLFVPGNHDYYYDSRENIDQQLKETKFKNIYSLIEEKIIFDNIIFLGSTGWFTEEINTLHTLSLTDFRLIKDIKFNDNGMSWGKKSFDFFNNELSKINKQKVICISHNTPSKLSIPDKFKNSKINNCFSNNWYGLIKKYQPNYWIHGHTHDSFNYFIDKTNVICNPFGYFKREENKEFDKNLIIEI